MTLTSEFYVRKGFLLLVGLCPQDTLQVRMDWPIIIVEMENRKFVQTLKIE